MFDENVFYVIIIIELLIFGSDSFFNKKIQPNRIMDTSKALTQTIVPIQIVFRNLKSHIYIHHFQIFTFESRSGVDKPHSCGRMKTRGKKVINLCDSFAFVV